MYRLNLNQEQSILLPNFDTTAILGSNIKEIILSLFVLDFKSSNKSSDIHLTINPFDPTTRRTESGLSIFFKPNERAYCDFRLPRELFESLVGPNKRLLVKIVTPDTKLVFAGPDSSGTATDPKLTVSYSDKADQENSMIGHLVVNNHYNYAIISNSQVHSGSGDNVGRDKIKKGGEALKKWYEKPLGIVFLMVVAGIIIFLLVG